MKTLFALLGVALALGGCGFMGLAMMEEASVATTAIVFAAIGAGLLAGGLLVNLTVNIEDIKETLEAQNEILISIGRSIEESRKTNVEIARRQFQAEKRQTGSPVERNKDR